MEENKIKPKVHHGIILNGKIHQLFEGSPNTINGHSKYTVMPTNYLLYPEIETPEGISFLFWIRRELDITEDYKLVKGFSTIAEPILIFVRIREHGEKINESSRTTTLPRGM